METPKEKADSIIKLCSGLSLKFNKSYALTYVDQILRNNPDLTEDKKNFWQSVKTELNKL